MTDAQVLNALKIINQHKATGVDKISARLLKIAAPAIAPRVSRLINYLISTGTFPQRWKTAKVMPLFKSGNPSDPSNYRLICILPILSKIIERHVHDSLYAFLSKLNLIFSRQSGFCKRHSAETALIKIIDELLLNLDNNRINDIW